MFESCIRIHDSATDAKYSIITISDKLTDILAKETLFWSSLKMCFPMKVGTMWCSFLTRTHVNKQEPSD